MSNLRLSAESRTRRDVHQVVDFGLRSSALVGMQPQLRQMPPRCSRSTTAVFSRAGRRGWRDIAARTAADDDEIEFLIISHFLAPYSSIRQRVFDQPLKAFMNSRPPRRRRRGDRPTGCRSSPWRWPAAPFLTTGRCSPAPTARMAPCGGLMMAENSLMPNMPRLEIEKPPPWNSSASACRFWRGRPDPSSRRDGGQALAGRPCLMIGVIRPPESRRRPKCRPRPLQDRVVGEAGIACRHLRSASARRP
jgi:hypothetical protein